MDEWGREWIKWMNKEWMKWMTEEWIIRSAEISIIHVAVYYIILTLNFLNQETSITILID